MFPTKIFRPLLPHKLEVKPKMKFLLTLVVLALSATATLADTVVLKNGDHLTGTITTVNSKQVTLKTDAAGDINIKWSAIQQLTSDTPLYVAMPENKTITGTVTLEGTDLVVHTATSGDVRVPIAQLTIVRTTEEQQAYEKSLHPGLTDDWTIGASLGFALARGNSSTTNLNTGATANRKTLSDEIKLAVSSIYARSGTSTSGTPGGVTASAVLAAAAYDRDISKRLFAFASADFTHDALQDLVLRQIYSAGLGWHTIKRPNTTLDAIFGVNYTRESYSSSATAIAPALNIDRNLPGLTIGEAFTHKFSSNTGVTEAFNFYPDLSDISQYRLALDSAIVTKIKKWLGWQATLSDRYVTNPPIPGTKSNDVILSTGLAVTFGH